MSRESSASAGGGSRLARAFSLAVSIVAVAAVVIWATKQEPPTLPTDTGELLALIAAVAVVGVAAALRSERWMMLLRREGGAPRRLDAYAIYAVGFMGNTVVPARGGDVLRVYLMAPRADLGLRNVIGTLIAERLLDVAFLLGLFAALAYFVLPGVDAPDSRYLGIAIASMTLAVVAGAVLLWRARDRSWALRVIEFVRPMLLATARLRGRHGAAMVGMTAVTWFADAAVYLLAARSVGLSIDPLEALYGIGVAGVFLLIPSGPAYAGTFDAGVLFGARAIGARGGEAVSFVIMLRLIIFLPMVLAGLLAYLVRYRTQPEHDVLARGPAR